MRSSDIYKASNCRMATEAADKNIVDAPAIAEPETTTTNPAAQDDSSKPSSVKDTASDGPATPNPEPSDLGVPSTEGSANGGSDSEALKAKGDGHVRTSSTAKKPVSFKSVSVNKKFLAAKGATASTAAKNGDMGAGASASPTPTSSTLVSKPRLVAKSGSGLLSSSSRLGGSSAGGSSSGAPDGNAVWNKNKPPPVPEVKRVTDEELAEKYGIHLATRLHSDANDKQANWADIDDEDDDWAPETMEWSDGTKVALPQTDSPVPKPAEPVPQAIAPRPPPPAVQAAAKQEKPASPGPSMTSSMKLGGGRGLVLKAGQSEKPTLVAKPPAPSVVKSPWAPLPPVDKASPVITELPPQHQQQRPSFINRNPHGFEGMSRHPPATEIAADDFSRGWRENDSGASRELYNSHSGRYEPVNDTRRGSRNDMHPHASTVLRRHEMQGPAEPSSQFQTHRDHVIDPSHGRRRTSSNVSGGSGLIGRRFSREQESYRPHDMPEARRGSFITSANAAPRRQSPADQQRGYLPQPQWQPRASPATAHAALAPGHGQQAPAQPPAIPYEDELELQKKIMRESRELARKRRLEQEAKEEAERKERIRLKLAAMGPPPELKKKKEEGMPAPTQIQTRDSTDSTQPKPPVAQAGEVKQFGMIKVHAPEAVKPQAATTEQVLNKQEQPQAREDTRLNGPSSSATAQAGRENSQEPEQSLAHNSQPSSPGRYPSWNQNQGPRTNLWGPPTNDRTLGNGTFNQELSMGVQGPGPIGPPLNSRGNGQFGPRGREPYSQRPAPIGPPSRQQEQRPASGSAPPGWAGDVASRIAEDDARRHAEIASQISARPPPPPTVFKDTWRPVQVGSDGRRVVGDAPQKEVGGPVSGGQQPQQQQQQTWVDFPQRPRQDDTPPHFAAVDHGVNAQQQWAQGMRESPSAMMPTPSRGSRFFPQGRPAQQEMPPPDQDYGRRPGSPTPPPPTMWGHPAYDGDFAHPHVSLPKPKPTVRLPASAAPATPAKVLAPIAPPKPISFAAAAAAAASIPSGPRVPVAVPNVPARSQAQAPGGGWQDKINSLMGRKGSPPKAHAMTVNSSSKHALDHSITQIPSISFPGFTNSGSDNGDYETKPMAEECFEEQEMGFVPVVKVPRDVPKNAYELAPAPRPLHWKVASMLETQSAREPEAILRAKTTKDGELIRIHLPCMEEGNVITVELKVDRRQRSNGRPRGRGGRGGSSGSYTRGGGRGRGGDRPSNYAGSTPNEGGSSSATAPSSTCRGGRGGRGSYGSSWNQRSSAPNAVNADA